MRRFALLVAVGLLLTRSAMADDTIVSWGRDNWDQVSDTPTDTGFQAIAAGDSHSLALTSDGSIVSWGRDYGGRGQSNGATR